MHVTVSDFTEVGRQLAAQLLRARYGKPVTPEFAVISSGATTADRAGGPADDGCDGPGFN